MRRNERIGATLALGALAAFVVVPPVMGFYWGWNTPVRAPGGGMWGPWAVALGQMFMSWLIYPLQLMEGDLFASPQGRSVAAAFVVATVLLSAAFYPWVRKRMP